MPSSLGVVPWLSPLASSGVALPIAVILPRTASREGRPNTLQGKGKQTELAQPMRIRASSVLEPPSIGLSTLSSTTTTSASIVIVSLVALATSLYCARSLCLGSQHRICLVARVHTCLTLQLTPVAAAPTERQVCTIPASFLRPSRVVTERGPGLDSILPGRLPPGKPTPNL